MRMTTQPPPLTVTTPTGTGSSPRLLAADPPPPVAVTPTNQAIYHADSVPARGRHLSVIQPIRSAQTAPHLAGAVETDRSRHLLNSADLHTLFKHKHHMGDFCTFSIQAIYVGNSTFLSMLLGDFLFLLNCHLVLPFRRRRRQLPHRYAVAPVGPRGGLAGHLAGDDARVEAPQHLRRRFLPRRAQHVLRLSRPEQRALAAAAAVDPVRLETDVG